MLHKIFVFGKNKQHNTLSDNPVRTGPKKTSGPEAKRSRAALKIVHVGGRTERYYMAVPASAIMEKNPSFVLARPEIFKRPWDSIVRPNEILVPGQRYYVVPRQTVKKLRSRVAQFDSSSSIEIVSSSRDEGSSCVSSGGRKPGRILVKGGGPRVETRNRRVRFFGLEEKIDGNIGADNGSTEMMRSKNRDEMKKRRVRRVIAWEPSLDAINE